MPNITLPDGKKLDFTESITGLKIAEKISKSLAKEALVMSVNGELKDLEHKALQLLALVLYSVLFQPFL